MLFRNLDQKLGGEKVPDSSTPHIFKSKGSVVIIRGQGLDRHKLKLNQVIKVSESQSALILAVEEVQVTALLLDAHPAQSIKPGQQLPADFKDEASSDVKLDFGAAQSISLANSGSHLVSLDGLASFPAPRLR